jgi:hypothetical protein
MVRECGNCAQRRVRSSVFNGGTPLASGVSLLHLALQE